MKTSTDPRGHRSAPYLLSTLVLLLSLLLRALRWARRIMRLESSR
ncbi:MAG TPA: hypothetical protein VLC95_02295 [Anaerolineae bacterium]|nr:hypothetical protein [Anaerolineae bacterium]